MVNHLKKENKSPEQEVEMQKIVLKTLLKCKGNKKYENEVAYILEGKTGVYYENKVYPWDYTFSTENYKIREITEKELLDIISKLQELKSKVSKEDTEFFYFGMMYDKEKFYELCYNFFRNQKDVQGKIEDDLPLSMKIKIYSNRNIFFRDDICKGIGVILRLKDKILFLEISHDKGEVLTKI